MSWSKSRYDAAKRSVKSALVEVVFKQVPTPHPGLPIPSGYVRNFIYDIGEVACGSPSSVVVRS